MREFIGNLPQVLKAYAWVARDGRRGHQRGVGPFRTREQLHGRSAHRRSAASPARIRDLAGPRMEMSRYSLETLTGTPALRVVDVQNRMTDFGIDAFWLSHEPWLVPSRSRQRRAKCGPRRTSTSGWPSCGSSAPRPTNTPKPSAPPPHHQAIHRIAGTAGRPRDWATTWRAYQRKQHQWLPVTQPGAQRADLTGGRHAVIEFCDSPDEAIRDVADGSTLLIRPAMAARASRSR